MEIHSAIHVMSEMMANQELTWDEVDALDTIKKKILDRYMRPKVIQICPFPGDNPHELVALGSDGEMWYCEFSCIRPIWEKIESNPYSKSRR